MHVNMLINTKIYYIKSLKCTTPLAYYFAKYKGDKLNYQQKEKAEQWIADRHLELLPFIINFNAEDEASSKLVEEPEESRQDVGDPESG